MHMHDDHYLTCRPCFAAGTVEGFDAVLRGGDLVLVCRSCGNALARFARPETLDHLAHGDCEVCRREGRVRTH